MLGKPFCQIVSLLQSRLAGACVETITLELHEVRISIMAV